jgi:hypothetical protein
MSSAPAVAVARTSTQQAASTVRKSHIALAAIPLIVCFELTPTLAKWFCHITRASIADTASGLCFVYDSARDGPGVVGDGGGIMRLIGAIAALCALVLVERAMGGKMRNR